MPEVEEGTRGNGGASRGRGRRKACCLVSEMLEEAGLDRRRARQLKRQVLEGMILLCRWQLERMGPERNGPRPRRPPRKVAVE